MPARHCLIVTLFVLVFVLPARSEAGLGVLVRPARPFIEDRGTTRVVNFDLRVANRSAQPLHLVGITMTAFDRGGAVEDERALDMNGFPGALGIVGPLALAAHGTEEIFQPFTVFPATMELARLHFDLAYMRAGREALPVPFMADTIVSVDVFPQAFAPAAYCLPLRGPVLVQDGHDFFSHHRRHARALPFEAATDTAPSPNLYAEDFVRVGGKGELFVGDPTDKRHWFTYGSPVFADADGTVAASATSLPEHGFLPDGSASPIDDARDPDGFGNYVVLLHPDGRASWFLHMQPGSVRVKTGEHVAAGAQLGLVGFSGDALFPHLHYTVTRGMAYPAQGEPVYFRDFDRIYGSRRAAVLRDPVDTGDFVQGASDCGDGLRAR